VLVDIIINGYRISAPPELIEHYYKKEYGLSTEQFMNEPCDRINWFMKIKEYENIRELQEYKKSQRK
jgi:hypothetical protein